MTVSDMDIQTDEDLSEAYSILEKGDIEGAKAVLGRIFEAQLQGRKQNLQSQEIRFAIWCCSFWKNPLNSFLQKENIECGDSIFNQWKLFLDSKNERERKVFTKAFFAIQKGVFTKALGAFSSSDGGGPFQRSETLRKQGMCLKKLGNHEEAIRRMWEANALTPSSAAVFAEMADCFALLGEEKKAKVLFREAFFIDASKIDIDFLDSELIHCLIRQAREGGKSGNALLEWIPIYGVLYGVFNVKRELTVTEVSRLKQQIFDKENELKNPANDSAMLVPRLINMYFWLIDHYTRSGYRVGIDECLIQIRVHDETVYKMYTGTK